MDKENKKLKTVEEITQELLKQLGVGVKFAVLEKDDAFYVQLETDQPGVLIGYHGETLAAIQLMIGMIAYRKLDEWVRVLVNVGDYQERRQEALGKMAASVAQKVKFSHQPQALPPMTSAERRIIHIALANDPGVETVSEGEDKERRVVVKPKNA
jgi:spoIIIJ-associated protein